MPALAKLDKQLAAPSAQVCGLSVRSRSHLATEIYSEVVAMSEAKLNVLRLSIAIAPEAYLDEMVAFEAWMDLARASTAPPVVRATVMTELYVAFVWLRDALLDPLRKALNPQSITASVIDFLRSDERRALRNAVAHGRWTYLPDFSGLEYWDGRPTLVRREIEQSVLNDWQMLGRGLIISVLLALAESSSS